MLTAAVVLFAQFKCLFIINQKKEKKKKKRTTWILQQAEWVLTLKNISSEKKAKSEMHI